MEAAYAHFMQESFPPELCPTVYQVSLKRIDAGTSETWTLEGTGHLLISVGKNSMSFAYGNDTATASIGFVGAGGLPPAVRGAERFPSWTKTAGYLRSPWPRSRPRASRCPRCCRCCGSRGGP